MYSRSCTSMLLVMAVAIVCGPSVMADPLPDEILKFQQMPLNNGLTPYYPNPVTGGGAPYPGHDELSTASRTSTDPLQPWQGVYMADDFADHFDTPVVHVRWWGSYLENFHGQGGVKQFLISFESDVPKSPTDPNSFSHPGVPLSNQIVTVTAGPLLPGSGTYTEKFVPTPGGNTAPLEGLYEYNAELHLDKYFYQQPDTVYWLKIVALVDVQRDGNIQWGWHNRDWSIPDPLASTPPAVIPGEGIISAVPIVDPATGFTSPVWHYQDDAVSGGVTVIPNPTMPNMPDVDQPDWLPQHYWSPWDGPSEINRYSKDLAFELYTRVPEPSGVAFVLVSSVSLPMFGRRRTK